MDLSLSNNNGSGSSSSTPEMLLLAIQGEPGIRYRELLRKTGLVNGVLTYHLSVLEKAGTIRVDRHSARMTRYYPVNVPESESQVLATCATNLCERSFPFCWSMTRPRLTR